MTDNPSSFVRIVAARINPMGHDPGSEAVMIANVGPNAIDIDGWTIYDRNQRGHMVSAKKLSAGEFYEIKLSGKDIQLSNQGGSITLTDNSGSFVHSVSYSKAQAKAQGITLLF